LAAQFYHEREDGNDGKKGAEAVLHCVQAYVAYAT